MFPPRRSPPSLRLLVPIALVVALAACQRDDADSAPDPASRTTDASQTSGDAAVDPATREREDAFGVPLPPRVLTIRRSEFEVEVTTDLNMKELGEFYEKNLVDYEIFVLRRGLRAIPLREHMPMIRGSTPFSNRDPKRVVYALPHQEKAIRALMSEPTGKGAVEDARRGRIIPPTSPTPPSRGAPVETRTASGELLAPGARWGEPYTPPPGSPLHTEEHQHNWGVPYGEWRAE